MKNFHQKRVIWMTVPAVISGDWKRISDIFSDQRPETEPTLQCAFAGINPAVGFSDEMRVIDCISKS